MVSQFAIIVAGAAAIKQLENEYGKSPEGRAVKLAQKVMDGEFSIKEFASSQLSKVGHLDRPELKEKLVTKLSNGPPLLFTMIEAGNGTGKSSLVHEIAIQERAKGRAVVYITLKKFQSAISLDGVFGEDWLVAHTALSSIRKGTDISLAPLIIIDDIQLLFDSHSSNSKGFCFPLLDLHESGIANVIFISSDGSVYDTMTKFSGFTRLVFYEWKRVSGDQMCEYVTGISANEAIQMKNKHVNAQSARVFADNFDGWFTGLSLWIDSGHTIEEYIDDKRVDLKDCVKDAVDDSQMREALIALCESKDTMLFSNYKKGFVELAKMKLVTIQRKSVQFSYPLIKTMVKEELKKQM